MPLKICVVSTPIFKLGPTGTAGYSGLEQLAWLQARGLAAKGHEVYLVAPDGSECPGATVIPVGVAQHVDEKMAFGGYKEAKEGETVKRRAHAGYWQQLLNMDVVIDNSWNKFSYTLKMEGRLKAPVLGVLHAPVRTMYQTLPPVDKPCFVCISQDQASEFEALFGREAEVAYNGIDLDVYKPIDVPRTDRFLFLARFSSVKSPHLNIDVCRKADVELDLVGDTKLTGEAEYLQSILHKADGKRIRFVGPATRGETVYWYSQARAFCHLCPTFREPFGLAPVEAMACGLPVLAWKYGAVKETVAHGHTGYLVKTEEEAVDVLRSGALDRLDRRDCQERARLFSVRNMVDRYEQLCFEALDGGW